MNENDKTNNKLNLRNIKEKALKSQKTSKKNKMKRKILTLRLKKIYKDLGKMGISCN